MKKYCANCGSAINARRSTKRYCSDRCKQAAFYVRTAQNLQHGTGSTCNIGELPFNVKAVLLEDDGGELEVEAGHPEKIQPNEHSISGKQPKPKPLRSDLIEEVGNTIYSDDTRLMMMQFPNKYWHFSDLEKVKWVSIRWRSIIENLLRLDRAIVELQLLSRLSEAMTALFRSSRYKCLPLNYPFREQIKQWQTILYNLSQNKKGVVRFKLLTEHKAGLMISRFLLADLVPFTKFAALDFSK